MSGQTQNVVKCGGELASFAAEKPGANSVAAALSGELNAIVEAVPGSDGIHAGDFGGDGFKATFPEESSFRPAQCAVLHDDFFYAEQGPD